MPDPLNRTEPIHLQFSSDYGLRDGDWKIVSFKGQEWELYNMANDRTEINNLAANPAYATKLGKMRGQLDDWMKATDDKGQQAEPENMYDSDMEVYLTKLQRKGDPVDLKRLEDNIALMKKWAAEGK